jgi:hypothetical protein
MRSWVLLTVDMMITFLSYDRESTMLLLRDPKWNVLPDPETVRHWQPESLSKVAREVAESSWLERDTG